MEGIFFARFDDVAGSVIECQVGECNEGKGETINSELWDRVNDFVIVRKEHCGKVITISDKDNSGKIVMSFPQFLEDDSRYSRNTFSFSFGFVFHPDTNHGHADIDSLGIFSYEHVLRKLSTVMATMELESRFLSLDGTKERLTPILEQILSQISEYGECYVQINSFNKLGLKVIPRLIDPPEVMDYQVPVAICDISELATQEWDLSLLKILPFVDDKRHVKLIAQLSGVAPVITRRCIRQLLYFRCVQLVDIFMYSNKYACTTRVIELAENYDLQKHCLNYVWAGSGEPPTHMKVFRLYIALRPTLEFKDFCIQHDTEGQGIDDRRFICFGLLHGLIRRVHEYPVLACAVPSFDSKYTEKMGYEEFCKNTEYCFFETIRRQVMRHVESEDITGLEVNEIRSDSGKSDSSPLNINNLNSDTIAPSMEKLDIRAYEAGYLCTLLNGKNSVDAICCELWSNVDDLYTNLRNIHRNGNLSRLTILQE